MAEKKINCSIGKTGHVLVTGLERSATRAKSRVRHYCVYPRPSPPITPQSQRPKLSPLSYTPTYSHDVFGEQNARSYDFRPRDVLYTRFSYDKNNERISYDFYFRFGRDNKQYCQIGAPSTEISSGDPMFTRDAAVETRKNGLYNRIIL